MSATAAGTVYFDGACPLCRKEIAHYRRRAGAEAIDWVDAATCDPAGAAAFATIWNSLPGYRWLAGLAARRPLLAVMEAAYAGFLRLRPLWRRAAASPAPLSEQALAYLRDSHALEAATIQFFRGILVTARDGETRAATAYELAVAHLRLKRPARPPAAAVAGDRVVRRRGIRAGWPSCGRRGVRGASAGGRSALCRPGRATGGARRPRRPAFDARCLPALDGGARQRARAPEDPAAPRCARLDGHRRQRRRARGGRAPARLTGPRAIRRSEPQR